MVTGRPVPPLAPRAGPLLAGSGTEGLSVLPRSVPAGCDGTMAGKTTATLPLLRLGRLHLDPALRARQPGSAASGLVVTATVAVPDAPTQRQVEWEVAWADAVRQAGQLGADADTAEALAVGADKPRTSGTRIVVAA